MNIHGYTTTDVIAAIVVVFVGFFVAGLLLANPVRILSEERNEVRLNEVHEIAEALIELRTTDAERFNVMLPEGRWAVGVGQECPQRCEVDGCVDLSSLTSDLIAEIPFDHYGRFSENETGYVVEVHADGFAVASCLDDEVRIEATF